MRINCEIMLAAMRYVLAALNAVSATVSVLAADEGGNV
jgi:hypothetical protein